MKTTFLSITAAAVIGVAAGAALGYWEARPWTIRPQAAEQATPKPDRAAAEEQPRAVVAETTFNFDKMESGTTQQHVFPIRNEGSAPLEVYFVSHTCKCTTVQLNGQPVEPGDQIVVAPGEEAEVLIEWAAKVAAGPFRHGASFTTDDPALSRLELLVEGDVVESTTVQPAQLLFGSVTVGKPAETELFVMASLEPEVKILSHEVLDAKLAERIKITVEPMDKADLPKSDAEAGVKVVATFDPGGTLGPFSGTLKLKTNLQRAPNLVLPIHGTVRGDISITGTGWTDAIGMLRMAPATSAEGGSSSLKIAIRGAHAAETELRIASVEPPELKASLGERLAIRDDMIHVPLAVEIPIGTRPMVRAGEDHGGEGEIILATTHPVTPEVRLRVTFTVKP